MDLVIPFYDKVISVEIKSGSEGTLRSLHQFVEATNHPYAVRMYAGEFKVSKTKTPGGKTWLLIHLPYYLGTKINDYLEYFLSSYKLNFKLKFAGLFISFGETGSTSLITCPLNTVISIPHVAFCLGVFRNLANEVAMELILTLDLPLKPADVTSFVRLDMVKFKIEILRHSYCH